jgi:hypothetical protein
VDRPRRAGFDADAPTDDPIGLDRAGLDAGASLIDLVAKFDERHEVIGRAVEMPGVAEVADPELRVRVVPGRRDAEPLGAPSDFCWPSSRGPRRCCRISDGTHGMPPFAGVR